MGVETKIEWCDHTFNPWRGCAKVHAGCAHCYAETGSKRNPGVLGIWGPNGTRVVAAEKTWGEPAEWINAHRGVRPVPQIPQVTAEMFSAAYKTGVSWRGSADYINARLAELAKQARKVGETCQ